MPPAWRGGRAGEGAAGRARGRRSLGMEQREGTSSGRREGGGAHESLMTGGGFKNAANLNAGWTPAGLGMRAACSPPYRERFWPGKCSTLLLGEAACPPVLHGAGLSQGKGLELGGPQCLKLPAPQPPVRERELAGTSGVHPDRRKKGKRSPGKGR